jgi:Zn-dependent protease
MGKIFGIQFRIHITFLFVLLFIFISGLPQHGWKKAAVSVLFICAVFACVMIHEISHSLIGQRFGKRAKSITLLPIGGVAAVEEMPEKPAQEILISAGGPLINLAIAGTLYLLVGWWSGIGVPNLYPESAEAFLRA